MHFKRYWNENFVFEIYCQMLPYEKWNIIAFSKNEKTYPNFVSQAREIEIFCEDCKLAAPFSFFSGLWASFLCTSIQVRSTS